MLHVFGPLILLIFQMLESQNPHQWVKMDFYGDIVLFLRVLSTKHAGFTYENCCLVCLILYVISLWAYTSSSNTLLCSVYTSAINSRLYKIQRYYIKKKTTKHDLEKKYNMEKEQTTVYSWLTVMAAAIHLLLEAQRGSRLLAVQSSEASARKEMIMKAVKWKCTFFLSQMTSFHF